MNPFTQCPHCDVTLSNRNFTESLPTCSNEDCPINFRQLVQHNEDGTVRWHTVMFEVDEYLVYNYYSEPKTAIYESHVTEGNASYSLNRIITWPWKNLEAIQDKIKLILTFS